VTSVTYYEWREGDYKLCQGLRLFQENEYKNKGISNAFLTASRRHVGSHNSSTPIDTSGAKWAYDNLKM
jgi:hypothetical protein